MESLLAIPHRLDLSWADKVAYLAYKISQNGGAKAEDIEVKHIFQKGLYIREFQLPEKIVFIGRVHTKGHVVELLYGSVNLLTEQGTKAYSAIDRISTPPGFQSVVYTLTPCLVRTLHDNPSECRDVLELENEFFGPIQPVLDRGEQVTQELQSAQELLQ
jgi:hypothetical protein